MQRRTQSNNTLLLLSCLSGASAVRDAANCESFCASPCKDLNGNVEIECGGCSSSNFACRPGQPFFSWRERAALKRTGKGETPLAGSGDPPSLPSTVLNDDGRDFVGLHEVFDEQHGCRPSDLADGDLCASWDPDELPARVALGRRICAHAYCVGRMLASAGHKTSGYGWAAGEPGYIGSPAAHVAHQYFPLRLAAADVLYGLCAQLARSHLLEGAGCLAVAANNTESHDIAVRWVGLDVMSRLLSTQRLQVGGWGAPGQPPWGKDGRPGSTLDTAVALDEMVRRLEHWQPGTRWMALHGVGAFAARADLSVLPGVLLALQGDMGFPGVGLLASEVLGRIYGSGSGSYADGSDLSCDSGVDGIGMEELRVCIAAAKALTALAAVLGDRHLEARGSSAELVRLLVVEAAWRLGGSTRGQQEASAAFEILASQHAQPAVRAAAFLALGAIRSTTPSAKVAAAAAVERDVDLRVRCAAQRLLGWIALQARPDDDEVSPDDDKQTPSPSHPAKHSEQCAADWTAAGARHRAAIHAQGVAEDEAVADAAESASATLERLEVAPASEEAAELCMLYLELVPSADAISTPHAEGMWQRMRWRALLTLRLVAPPNSPVVRARALAMLRSNDVMTRYSAIKALALNTVTTFQSADAAPGDEIIAALANALRDWVDVIKLQAGEHLVELTPRTPHGVRRSADALLTELASEDRYTRFAAAVTLRKLAAICDSPADGTETMPDAVVATLFGQLHASAAGISNSVERVRHLLDTCLQRPARRLVVVDAAGHGADVTGSASAVHTATKQANELSARNTQGMPNEFDASNPLTTNLPQPSKSSAASATGVVGPAHCFAQIRELPEGVLAAAYAEFSALKSCSFSKLSQARASGLLLVPSVISKAAREVNLNYLQELRLNSTGATQDAKRFHGRSTFRGGRMNSPAEIDSVNPELLDSLDNLLRGWDESGLTPALTYLPPSEAATGALHVREIEHVVLEPEEHDCPWGPELGIPCGCDWHVDGGIRGYKMWAPLQKEDKPDSRAQQNIVVAPLNNAQQLCELVERLNATIGADTLAKEGVRAQPKDEWQLRTDADGTSGWSLEDGYEAHGRRSDKRALEAASCVVEADAGDVLLFFPGVFHRTQDVDGKRVAIIAEATR